MNADRHRYVRSSWVMTHLVNPVVVRLNGTVVLLVPGRETGRPRAVPLGSPLEIDGALYLVAGGGETQWVRNLRAAGGGQLRLQGRTRTFRAAELEGDDQRRVVTAYRATMGRRADAFFRQLPEPADHPAFRVDWVD